MSAPRSLALVANGVLLTAIGVDVVLPALSYAQPTWWFDVLHVGVSPDAMDLALLHRAAAQWIAFALLQIIALVDWRRWPDWLLLVAGARTSDWLTDLTYFAVAPDLSSWRWALLAPPLLNFGMSLILFGVWRRVRASAEQ